MPDVGGLYMQGMHGECKLLAAWLPTAEIRLGDVGVLDKEHFAHVTTLQALGIPFGVRRGTSPGNLTYKSGAEFSANVSGQVTAAGGGEASASLSFSKKGGFVFHAAGCLTDEIEDKQAVGKEAIKLLGKGKWEPKWSVVDTVVHADRATILISTTDSSVADLTGKAPLASANLANVSVGLNVAVRHGDVLQYVAHAKLTPLFNLSRVKRSLLEIILGRGGHPEFDRIQTDYTAGIGGEQAGRALSAERINAELLEGDVLEPVPPP